MLDAVMIPAMVNDAAAMCSGGAAQARREDCHNRGMRDACLGDTQRGGVRAPVPASPRISLASLVWKPLSLRPLAPPDDRPFVPPGTHTMRALRDSELLSHPNLCTAIVQDWAKIPLVPVLKALPARTLMRGAAPMMIPRRASAC